MYLRKSLDIAIVAAIAGLAFVSTTQAQQPAGSLVWSKDPGNQCAFVAPLSLTKGPTYWTGACPGNKASGKGMLRRRDGNQAGAAFYGEMQAGIPVIGVIDDQGYRVGRFRNGDIGGENETDFQERLDAFDAAVKAARAVSAEYAKQGNTASSRHYDDIAKQLEMQIE